MNDVVATLDKEEINKIKTYKLDKKLEDCCSICMTPMDKDQTVSELGCKHTFHKDCINTYLEKYNYKCPICRKECGKPVYN
jgi:hypothetical protein